MKNIVCKVIATLPDVFSFRSYDYNRLAGSVSASQMMESAWLRIGLRMYGAIDVVSKDLGGDEVLFVSVQKGRAALKAVPADRKSHVCTAE